MGGCALGLLLLASGCASVQPRAREADGTWCHRHGSGPRFTTTCSRGPVPSDAAEAEARTLRADPRLLTVYLVRSRHADEVGRVAVSIGGAEAAELLPESFVRLRLQPGAHRLAAHWPDGEARTEVLGAAGDVRVMELAGVVWAWGARYRFEAGDPASLQARFQSARLVADVIVDP